MVTLAVIHSLTDRLHEIPAAVWTRIALGVLGLILAVLVITKLAKMNKVVLGVLVFLVLSFVAFNWIYERNEPKWATPVVEKVATFFPSKDAMK